jgi:DnaJ-class molecular chaperone
MADDWGMIGGDAYEDVPRCEDCEQELEWEECHECGGEGFIDGDRLMDEDPLWYGPDDTETCSECNGAGGWHYCSNKECSVVRVEHG